jgi:hypothetical protein
MRHCLCLGVFVSFNPSFPLSVFSHSRGSHCPSRQRPIEALIYQLVLLILKTASTRYTAVVMTVILIVDIQTVRRDYLHLCENCYLRCSGNFKNIKFNLVIVHYRLILFCYDEENASLSNFTFSCANICQRHAETDDNQS